MCFSVPCKIIKINQDEVLIEGGKVVKIGKDLTIKKSDYLQVVGNIAVGKLSKREGLKIRRLIKSLSTHE